MSEIEEIISLLIVTVPVQKKEFRDALDLLHDRCNFLQKR